jgi:single-strand DNA-binding protein
MAARSLNKVILIGNLTRDPELRYTPSGTAVCTFGLATNRSWTTQNGELKEQTEFHRIVAWNKLAELCQQLLTKGRKIFAEGRLSTRAWTGQDGTQRSTTEIVIEDMIILDSKKIVKDEIATTSTVETKSDEDIIADLDNVEFSVDEEKQTKETKSKKNTKSEKKDDEPKEEAEKSNEDIIPDDIPF